MDPRFDPADAPRFIAPLQALIDDLLHDAFLDLICTVSAGNPGERPLLTAEFSGPDLPLLLARNAELLLAFEHLAAKHLRLVSEEHDLISFDAGGFKAKRQNALESAARRAIAEVRSSGRPFAFPPMSSRERRLLHLTLTGSGLLTASEGEGAHRHLVLYAP